MTRTDAREFMMQVYYQMDIQNDYSVDNEEKYLKEKNIKSQEHYCSTLYSLLCNKHEELDQLINSNSTGWTTKRIPKTVLAILRLAICEINHIDDVPQPVAVNEAIELAKKYGTDHSSAYVNAVLGKITASKKAEIQNDK